jgi:hypothetical protein
MTKQKSNNKKFEIWFEHIELFSIAVETDCLQKVLEIANSMSLKELVKGERTQISEEYHITGVMEV